MVVQAGSLVSSGSPCFFDVKMCFCGPVPMERDVNVYADMNGNMHHM